MLKGENMGLGEVAYMDVITNAGSVRRLITVAIHDHDCIIAGGGKDSRNQMELRIVGFTNFASRVGTSGVKISQRDGSYLMRLPDIREHSLYDKL